MPGMFDGFCEPSLVLCTKAGLYRRNNFSSISDKLLQLSDLLIIRLFICLAKLTVNLPHVITKFSLP